MAVLRNGGSLSLQRLTSPRRLGEAVTGTRTALFLLHLSNLRKPRVRKHKVFSKLVNRPLKRSQRSQQPSDKVPSHYHSIDSRDFAYLTGKFHFAFLTRGIMHPLYIKFISTLPIFCLCFFFFFPPPLIWLGKCVSLAKRTTFKSMELNYMSVWTHKLDHRFKVNCFARLFICFVGPFVFRAD